MQFMNKLATFDTEKLITDLNARRFQLRYSWRDIAAETGVSASTLTRMTQGRDPDIHGLASLLTWLGEPYVSYIVPEGLQ
jgi:transcriptional regulator with XRE-family HTH domain